MPALRHAMACLTLFAGGAQALAPLGATGPGRDALDNVDTNPPDAAATPALHGEAVLLGITLNEVEQADAVLVWRRRGRGPAVPASVLAAWRVRRPAGPALYFEAQEYVELAAIPDAQWHEDAASQMLVLRLPSAAFLRNDFEIANPQRPTQAQARLGGFVNYDVHWRRDTAAGLAPATEIASGLVETGVFSAHGNGLSSGVWRHGAGAPRFTRLDTSWNVDMPSSLASVRAGDAISSAGAWGRSVRFGGIQWATNFAVQPGLVTFPLPSIRGEATVPSVVDLFINSNQQLQGRLPPGAFDLPDVPVVAGQGQIRMVVRDLLGREHVIVQPYYVSPALLRPGLHEFGIEAGSLREDYGLESQRYGRAFASATDRLGVSSTFTREVRVEAMRDRQSFGLGGVWQVLEQATANAAGAVSRGPDGAGGLVTFGVDRQAAAWSARAQVRLISRQFVGVGQPSALAFASAPRSAFSAGIGSALGNGSVGLDLLQQSTWQGDRFSVLTLTHGRPVGRLGHLSVFASRTSGAARGTTIGLNLITVLGADTSVSVGHWHDRDSRQTTLQLQGDAPVGPGLGYQIQADRGTHERFSAEALAQGDVASVNAGVGRANGADSYRLGASGAVALMPEGVYLSRRIEGSFAVVQVSDYAGVRVNRDNHFVARTDAHGRAFVAGLRGFESNQISIEAGDLPLDAQVDQLRIEVAPGLRSGVSVLFPVRRTRAASLRLVTVDGVPVPAGVSARMDGDPHDFPVGFDGKLFLVNLRERTTVSVAWEGRRCEATVELDAAAGDVPELGTQVCR